MIELSIKRFHHAKIIINVLKTFCHVVNNNIIIIDINKILENVRTNSYGFKFIERFCNVVVLVRYLC